MGEILFYRIDCDQSSPPAVPSLAEIATEIWRPSNAGHAPNCGLSNLSRMAWLALHWLDLLGNRDYAILWLHRNGVCVHRTMLIPPFFRFPFMAPGDLQCGNIWTEPAERGRGLAVAGVSTAVRYAWRSGRRIWYLTEADNEASQRLARRTGFCLVGHGERTRLLGMRLFGQFVVTSANDKIR